MLELALALEVEVEVVEEESLVLRIKKELLEADGRNADALGRNDAIHVNATVFILLI